MNVKIVQLMVSTLSCSLIIQVLDAKTELKSPMLESDHFAAFPANSQEPSTPTVEIKLKNSAETAYSHVFSSANSSRNEIAILFHFGFGVFSKRKFFSRKQFVR
ncbi:hypothetical protein CDAR_123981 [Caerostris darwini]|uniref:Uncharacterized protein n=1 Tax=Caerostris darwini TaxID=1538125 RepID=A0AAV4TM89_9ARAC|nr:hypothetical protein CDAR_123981 [Caerostris darwini]